MHFETDTRIEGISATDIFTLSAALGATIEDQLVATQIGDVPRSDRGGNFGRYARTGIMDPYLAQALAQPVCGIAAGSWLDFFKLFTESASERAVAERIALLRRKMADTATTADRSKADVYLRILDILEANV
jgi:hypothetical protein